MQAAGLQGYRWDLAIVCVWVRVCVFIFNKYLCAVTSPTQPTSYSLCPLSTPFSRPSICFSNLYTRISAVAFVVDVAAAVRRCCCCVDVAAAAAAVLLLLLCLLSGATDLENLALLHIDERCD